MKKLLFALLAIAVSPPIFAQESGTITSTQCVAIDVKVDKSTVGIQVTGTWAGTLQPQVSIQGQPAVNAQVVPSTSTTPQSTITGNGVFYANVGGGGIFQICGNTVGSGTANIFLNGSKGVNAGTLSFGGGSIAAGTTGQPAVYTSGSAIGSTAAWLHATAFAGATVDVKVNACIAAVIAAGGGTCDARALGGAQTVAAEIDVGDSNQDNVTLLLPPSGQWTATAVDGVSCAIKQWSNTAIIGSNPGGAADFAIKAGGSSNLGYVYCTDPANPSSTRTGGKYIYASGFAIENFGVATANNVGFYVNGYQDGSTWDNILVSDTKDTLAALLDGVCCGASFRSFSVQSAYAAGTTPLTIRRNVSAVSNNQALNFFGLSVGHPGAGNPNINITDTSGTASQIINIYGLYMESGQTNGTNCMVTMSGNRAVNFYGANFRAQATGSNTFGGICNDSVFHTQIFAGGLSFTGSAAGSFTLPAVAVSDAATGDIANTDTNGNLGTFGGAGNFFHAGTFGAGATQLTVQNDAHTGDTFSYNVLDNGSGGTVVNQEPTITTAGQGATFSWCRVFSDTGGCYFQMFRGNNTTTVDFSINNRGLFDHYHSLTTAGQGVAPILGATSQKAETTTADANVLTVTPSATAGTYRACVVISVSAATSGVIGWTLSWTDSNGTAQSNIAQSLFQQGTAAPALTFTVSAAGNYQSCSQIDVNNAAAAIIVKWVGGGTTTAKMSATIEEVQ